MLIRNTSPSSPRILHSAHRNSNERQRLRGNNQLPLLKGGQERTQTNERLATNNTPKTSSLKNFFVGLISRITRKGPETNANETGQLAIANVEQTQSDGAGTLTVEAVQVPETAQADANGNGNGQAVAADASSNSEIKQTETQNGGAAIPPEEAPATTANLNEETTSTAIKKANKKTAENPQSDVRVLVRRTDRQYVVPTNYGSISARILKFMGSFEQLNDHYRQPSFMNPISNNEREQREFSQLLVTLCGLSNQKLAQLENRHVSQIVELLNTLFAADIQNNRSLEEYLSEMTGMRTHNVMKATIPGLLHLGQKLKPLLNKKKQFSFSIDTELNKIKEKLDNVVVVEVIHPMTQLASDMASFIEFADSSDIKQKAENDGQTYPLVVSVKRMEYTKILNTLSSLSTNDLLSIKQNDLARIQESLNKAIELISQSPITIQRITDINPRNLSKDSPLITKLNRLAEAVGSIIDLARWRETDESGFKAHLQSVLEPSTAEEDYVTNVRNMTALLETARSESVQKEFEKANTNGLSYPLTVSEDRQIFTSTLSHLSNLSTDDLINISQEDLNGVQQPLEEALDLISKNSELVQRITNIALEDLRKDSPLIIKLSRVNEALTFMIQNPIWRITGLDTFKNHIQFSILEPQDQAEEVDNPINDVDELFPDYSPNNTYFPGSEPEQISNAEPVPIQEAKIQQVLNTGKTLTTSGVIFPTEDQQVSGIEVISEPDQDTVAIQDAESQQSQQTNGSSGGGPKGVEIKLEETDWDTTLKLLIPQKPFA